MGTTAIGYSSAKSSETSMKYRVLLTIGNSSAVCGSPPAVRRNFSANSFMIISPL
ncbi:hypothetical protein HAX54_029017, partial [Datura stramonium]|nr:hypothetical protein [Datura stramonium]